MNCSTHDSLQFVYSFALTKHEDHLKYSKLSCSRGTARRAVSVETVRNVAHMLHEFHLLFCKARNSQMTFKAIQGHRKLNDSKGHMTLANSGLYQQRVYLAPLLRYYSAFTVYFPACNLETSFHF